MFKNRTSNDNKEFKLTNISNLSLLRKQNKSI